MFSPTGIELYFSEDEGTPSVAEGGRERVLNETPSRKEIQQEQQTLNAKALNGDATYVRNALAKKRHLTQTSDGMNVLHAACCGLQLNVIKEVLVNNSCLLQRVEPEQKRTPIHCALGAAFDKEELEEDGIVLATSLLPDIISLLVSKSDEVVFLYQDLFGRTPLHIAATLADIDVATTVLMATPPSAFHLRNHNGDTALHIASRNALRDTNFLELLLSRFLPLSHLGSVEGGPSLPMWSRLFHKKKKSDRLPHAQTTRSNSVEMAAVDDVQKKFTLKDLNGSGVVERVAVPPPVITPTKSSGSSSDSEFDVTPLRHVKASPPPETQPAHRVVADGGGDDDKQHAPTTFIDMEGSEPKKVVWLLRIANHALEPALPPPVARELLLRTSDRLVAKLLLESVCSDSDTECEPPLTSFTFDILEDDIEYLLDTHGTTWIDVLDTMVSMIEVRYRFAAAQTLFAGALVIGDEVTDYLVTILLFADQKYFWAGLSTTILLVSQMTLVALLTRMGKSAKYKHAFAWVPKKTMRLLPVAFDAKVFWAATTNLWTVTDLTKTKSLQGFTISLAFLEAVTESIPQAALQFFLYRSKHKDKNETDTQFYLLVVSLSISLLSVLKAIVTYIYFKCFNRTNVLGIIKPVGVSTE